MGRQAIQKPAACGCPRDTADSMESRAAPATGRIAFTTMGRAALGKKVGRALPRPSSATTSRARFSRASRRRARGLDGGLRPFDRATRQYGGETTVPVTESKATSRLARSEATQRCDQVHYSPAKERKHSTRMECGIRRRAQRQGSRYPFTPLVARLSPPPRSSSRARPTRVPSGGVDRATGLRRMPRGRSGAPTGAAGYLRSA